MSLNFFFGEVVKVTGSEKDHDYAGDVQIRVEIDQDDKKRLKDEDLRWARNIWPVTAAQHRGVGISGGGAIPGTRVFGFYADNDRQIPYILGTVATAGKYGSLEVGDAETRARGLAGFTNAPIGQLGSTVLDYPTDNKDAKELVDASVKDSKTPAKIRPKAKTPQTDAENAPQAKNPSLTGMKMPQSVADMVALIKNFNPKNIGGMFSTLGAFQNIRPKTEGKVNKLVGDLPLSQLKMISGIININPNNILGSLSTIMKGLSGMIGALGGPDKAQEMINNGMFNSIPMGPLQNLAMNILTGALKSQNNNPALLSSVSNALNELSSGGSLTTDDMRNLTSILSQFANLGPNTDNSISQLILIGNITQQIEKLTQNIDMSNGAQNLLNDVSSGAINEIQSLASQAGNILGVGNQLSTLVNEPTKLLNTLQSLVSGNITNTLGNMIGGNSPQQNQQNPGSDKRIPPDPAKPEYPYNQVTKTTGGHTTKIDNTPGKEQLFVSHKANTFFRIDPDGSLIVHGAKNSHEQVKGTKTVTVEGFSDVTVKGSKLVIRGGSLVEVMGKCDIKVAGDCTLIVSDNIKMTGKNITMAAEEKIYMNAENIEMIATSDIKETAGINHITDATTVSEKASGSIVEESDGSVETTAKGGNVNIKAKGNVTTKGKLTQIQGPGVTAPPTVFTS